MVIFHFLLLQDSLIVLKCERSQAEAVAGERRVEREAAGRARLSVGGGGGDK